VSLSAETSSRTLTLEIKATTQWRTQSILMGGVHSLYLNSI